MHNPSRRQWLTAAGIGIAGTAAYVVGDRVAARAGLVPPDNVGFYGAGQTLTYAAQRLLTRNSMAREFKPEQISRKPFANPVAPLGDNYKRLASGGFVDWRLTVDGMVSRPMSFSLSDIRKFPESRQITHLACEEGWSYIAQWIGVPLFHILQAAGMSSSASHIVYRSFQPDWWESIDMADALHPQTLVSYGMNGGSLPIAFGGPLRLRVPRQLGYKSIKYLVHLTATDNIKSIGNGLGSFEPDSGYSWYAGI
jgi:DMSO/TMAO reductase YedYZ molybdopterin-dependent catalytic subunit